jgi:hypothetical protein
MMVVLRCLKFLHNQNLLTKIFLIEIQKKQNQMTLVLVEAEKNIKNVVELFKKMERLLHFFSYRNCR